MIDKSIKYSLARNGVVTFLDVLGWKGVWQRKNGAINDLENIVNEIKKIAKIKERGKKGYGTSVMIVSDTIVLFTEADFNNVKEKIELHGEFCAKAIPISIKRGLPLRGATSFGEVVISDKNSIFAGKAIDEAASWHENADWIGVFLTPSANFVFTDYPSEYWVIYKPPLKNKEANYKTYSVVWFNKGKDNKYVNDVKKDLTQLAPIIPDILPKFSNTIEYIENQKTNQKANKNTATNK